MSQETPTGLHEDDAYADLGGGRHTYYQEGTLDTEPAKPRRPLTGKAGLAQGKQLEATEGRQAGPPMDVPPAAGSEEIYATGVALARKSLDEASKPAANGQVVEQPKLPLE